MKRLEWKLLHPRMTMDHLGYIPDFIYENDPRPASKQIHERYRFGGWIPFKGFTLGDDNSLQYPGDPLFKPYAQAQLRDETICFYQSSWVAIIQKDRTFEVARLD